MTGGLLQVGYFGKLPSQSDFVRSASHYVLTELLDQWLADVMQRLAANPRWRQHYDAMEPLRFAFLGTRSPLVVLGHLTASRDQSQRRFPFVCTVQRGVPQGEDFLACCPLALAPAWAALEQAAASGKFAPLHSSCDLPAAGAAFRAFLQSETVEGLGRLLGVEPAGRLVLSVGLLLEDAYGAGAPPTRCLALPLPADPARRHAVAAFWLALAQPLLLRSDLELALFIIQSGGRHMLVLGMDGANPSALHALIDPEAAAEVLLPYSELGWVEAALDTRPKAQRLDACLAQAGLGLSTALQLYRECFA